MGREAALHMKACAQHARPQGFAEFRYRLETFLSAQHQGIASTATPETPGPVKADGKAAVPQPVSDCLCASDIVAEGTNIVDTSQSVVQARAGNRAPAQAMRGLECRPQLFNQLAGLTFWSEGKEKCFRRAAGNGPQHRVLKGT